MVFNGVDIDQYLLLITYPSIAFFITGHITKKKNIKKTPTYVLQSIICFIFSISYYLFVPHEGALGLSIVLGLFGRTSFYKKYERRNKEQNYRF